MNPHLLLLEHFKTFLKKISSGLEKSTRIKILISNHISLCFLGDGSAFRKQAKKYQAENLFKIK